MWQVIDGSGSKGEGNKKIDDLDKEKVVLSSKRKAAGAFWNRKRSTASMG